MILSKLQQSVEKHTQYSLTHKAKDFIQKYLKPFISLRYKRFFMRIVLIGSGNVASQLGLALHAANHNMLQVYSRDINNATLLADKINADPINDLTKIDYSADLYIISVKDDALKNVIQSLPVLEGIVCHTAGSIEIDVLSKFSNYGVFYPFQTITKNKDIDCYSLPILLEGNSETVLMELHKLAKAISQNVNEVSSLQRGQLHIAAVFACNFVNHMYRMADDLLKESNLSFDLLKPLILETANKVMSMAPSETQTGPASRNDMEVIEKHSRNLQSKEPYDYVYDSLTQLILKANNT